MLQLKHDPEKWEPVLGKDRAQTRSFSTGGGMPRAAIKDKLNRTLGYIDTMSDEKQKALDHLNRTLGYYDPKRNVTLDNLNRTIAQGNVLSSLIFKPR